MDDPLFCLVCGFERGGTTLVAELIRQHPEIDGRFECGFLLADKMADYVDLEIYVRNLKAGWGLSQESFEYIVQSPTHRTAYQRLVKYSNLPDKNIRIYDKTPRYMRHLPNVLKKVDVPCICVVRDPRALYWSQRKHFDHDELLHQEYEHVYHTLTRFSRVPVINWLSRKYLERQREKVWLERFCGYFLRYGNAWKTANDLFPGRILLVSHDNLCTHPKGETQRIYDFLGLAFEDEYIKLPTTPDPYVDRGGIIPDLIYEYRKGLSKTDQDTLIDRTKEFAEWHWHEA
jgi:hypothetical protein